MGALVSVFVGALVTVSVGARVGIVSAPVGVPVDVLVRGLVRVPVGVFVDVPAGARVSASMVLALQEVLKGLEFLLVMCSFACGRDVA